MVLVDTGYLIALFTEADELHERATQWACACADRLVVTEYVLIEVTNHFSQPQNRNRASAVRDWVTTDPMCEFVPASPLLSEAGWKLFLARNDKYWSLTDCISFDLMNQRGMSDALAQSDDADTVGFHGRLPES